MVERQLRLVPGRRSARRGVPFISKEQDRGGVPIRPLGISERCRPRSASIPHEMPLRSSPHPTRLPGGDHLPDPGEPLLPTPLARAARGGQRHHRPRRQPLERGHRPLGLRIQTTATSWLARRTPSTSPASWARSTPRPRSAPATPRGSATSSARPGPLAQAPRGQTGVPPRLRGPLRRSTSRQPRGCLPRRLLPPRPALLLGPRSHLTV